MSSPRNACTPSSLEGKQMTSDTKKQSLPEQVTMIDERDPLWSSLNSLTAGMTPDERADYLMNLVDSLTEQKKD